MNFISDCLSANVTGGFAADGSRLTSEVEGSGWEVRDASRPFLKGKERNWDELSCAGAACSADKSPGDVPVLSPGDKFHN